MALPLIQRDPTPVEVERLRLVLSTYQDGFGMLAVPDSARTLPGWRDFERSVAAAFGGTPSESKAIFDVLIPDPENMGVEYGLSCKMRGTLRNTESTGRVTIEVANAAGAFWDHINSKGYDQTNYRAHPAEVGAALTEVVEGWHGSVGLHNGGTVDLIRSYYLVLSWHRPSGRYQLHQFDIVMPDPDSLRWSFPSSQGGGPGRRLVGEDEKGMLLEWYGESGGQLKYYPPVSAALWASEPFVLEPLPEGSYGLLGKAELYFRDLWDAAQEG